MVRNMDVPARNTLESPKACLTYWRSWITARTIEATLSSAKCKMFIRYQAYPHIVVPRILTIFKLAVNHFCQPLEIFVEKIDVLNKQLWIRQLKEDKSFSEPMMIEAYEKWFRTTYEQRILEKYHNDVETYNVINNNNGVANALLSLPEKYKFEFGVTHFPDDKIYEFGHSHLGTENIWLKHLWKISKAKRGGNGVEVSHLDHLEVRVLEHLFEITPHNNCTICEDIDDYQYARDWCVLKRHMIVKFKQLCELKN